MAINKKYSTTTIFKSYEGKDTSQFNTFQEKIACARVNFDNGKKKKAGLSLTEAANKIGIDINYLRRLETGERTNPSAAIVHKIETVYKFKPGELAKVLAETCCTKAG